MVGDNPRPPTSIPTKIWSGNDLHLEPLDDEPVFLAKTEADAEALFSRTKRRKA